MSEELTPLSKAEQAIAEATTPEESQEMEAWIAAYKQFAAERNDYEAILDSWRLWILARRKTTELLIPIIPPPGRPNKGSASRTILEKYNLKKATWHGRKKEAQKDIEEINSYIAACKEKCVEPTIKGLIENRIIGESTGNEWWTPQEYIASVRAVLGDIDLDPASCAEANDIIDAKTYYTEADDGLTKQWTGRVFMNPPYSANKEFAEKLRDEFNGGNVTSAIVLLGAHAIETKWFAPYWDYTLCFTGHRIKFNTPEGQAVAGNIAGSVFIYLGEDDHKFADEFDPKHGYVVKRWR